MKILFLISSKKKASGGHYHSCDQISRALSKKFEVGIVSIGLNESPVLVRNQFFIKHLNFRSILDLNSLNSSLSVIKKQLNPDIVHCFDTESMNTVLPLPVFLKVKIVLTKCGGPNPIREKWQFANALINFSLENHHWFSSNRNYDVTSLFHIPNRVNRMEVENFQEKEEKRKEDTFTFLRISRIGGAYEKTLIDSFNLIENFDKKYKVRLLVIGRIQDEARYNQLKNIAQKRNLPVKFITDERTSKASDFLYLGDCVIGTGRSFMEATSLGIPTLTPVKNHNMPILVKKDNFKIFFKTNFSERNVADNLSIQNNGDLISKLIEDNTFYRKIELETSNIFNENFSLENIIPRYKEVYQIALLSKESRWDLLWKNKYYVLKRIITI